MRSPREPGGERGGGQDEPEEVGSQGDADKDSKKERSERMMAGKPREGGSEGMLTEEEDGSIWTGLGASGQRSVTRM